MTADPRVAAETPPSPSDAALARHEAAMRRQGRIFAAVVGVLVLITAVIVARVWATGEVNNTVLRTAAAPPASIAATSPAPALTRAWATTDSAALGTPVWNGTAVTYDGHTVRGRDAQTGAQTWSYYRSNRQLCSVAQAAGTTMALYRVNANCDELTAVASDTGQRKWTRTLDMDGHPVNGTPSVSVTPYTLLVGSSTVLYAIDPSSGYDRWEYHPDKCQVQKAVLGSSGVLISQTCTTPECANLRMCGDGPQLLLRDAYAGRDDKKSQLDQDGQNPDQLVWNKIGDTDIPLSADVVISALNRSTRALDILDSKTGQSTALALVPVPASLTDISSTPTTGNVLVWASGTVYAIGSDSRLAWTQRAAGPPTVWPASPLEWPAQITAARVTIPAVGGVLTVRPERGNLVVRSSGVEPVPGSLAYPLGSGFLLAAPDGTAAYR